MPISRIDRRSNIISFKEGSQRIRETRANNLKTPRGEAFAELTQAPSAGLEVGHWRRWDYQAIADSLCATLTREEEVIKFQLGKAHITFLVGTRAPVPLLLLHPEFRYAYYVYGQTTMPVEDIENINPKPGSIDIWILESPTPYTIYSHGGFRSPPGVHRGR